MRTNQTAQSFITGSQKPPRQKLCNQFGPLFPSLTVNPCPESSSWSYPFCFPALEDSVCEWSDELSCALFCKKVYVLCRIKMHELSLIRVLHRELERCLFPKRDKSWTFIASLWQLARDYYGLEKKAKVFGVFKISRKRSLFLCFLKGRGFCNQNNWTLNLYSTQPMLSSQSFPDSTFFTFPHCRTCHSVWLQANSIVIGLWKYSEVQQLTMSMF